MTMTVDYDLNKPGQNYERLFKALETLGAKRILLSKWILSSNLTAEALGTYLGQFIDANDRLFVAELVGNWWGWNLMFNPKDLQNAATRTLYR